MREVTAQGSVLVVGGGIGGLSASIALRDAGYDVHVVERQPDMRSSVFGVGIIQPANALRALAEIGCAEPCLEQGYAGSAWMRSYTTDGELIFELEGDRDSGFPPMNGITRPRLHRILTDRALEVGVTVEYGTTISSLSQSDDRVEVGFSNSTQATFDLVVGADGVYSQIRELVLGPIEPTYVGQSAFRVNVPRLPEVDSIVIQKAPDGGTAGIVPLADDLAYLFMNVVWDKNHRPAPDELYGILWRYLEPFGGLIGEIRDRHLDSAADIVLRPEEYLIVPRPWYAGRVVLLGDAVHAVTPVLAQGAAQAIEDGVVLAQELAATADVETAFARYVERRYERCRLIVEGCAQIGAWARVEGFEHEEWELRRRVLDAVAQPI